MNTASVTLDWGEGGEFKRKIREMRRAFEEMDMDGNGTLTRDEFSLAITKQPSLREFLSWSMGVDHAAASGSRNASAHEAECETVLAPSTTSTQTKMTDCHSQSFPHSFFHVRGQILKDCAQR